ncbi:hypothetical protein, partial [Klebsiella pneumoniae]|uniref:hypothetical protein n=1 Tax=Klebsiella pneumoniae TaxID=573 RepID=UPI00210B636B
RYGPEMVEFFHQRTAVQFLSGSAMPDFHPAQAREYVLENSAEPLTVLDLCQQLLLRAKTAAERQQKQRGEEKTQPKKREHRHAGDRLAGKYP